MTYLIIYSISIISISQKHPECLVKNDTYLSDIVTDFPEHQISNLENIRESEIQQIKYEKALNIERRKMYIYNEIHYDITLFIY